MNEKLRTCDDCGGKVSKRAASCPHCGAPQEPTAEVEEEISAEEQNLIDERRHDEWEQILRKDQNKTQSYSKGIQNPRHQSFIYKILDKKIFWKFNLLTLITISTFLVISFIVSAKYFWEDKTNEKYLANSEKINSFIDKYIDAKKYKKALTIIDYYQGNFFSHESLRKKKNLAEKRMVIYEKFNEKYKNFSILDRWDTASACRFLEENYSKGFLEKEFIDAQINLQKKSINRLKNRTIDYDIIRKVEKSYTYLNEVSKNAYLDEFNKWEIKNKSTIEKVIANEVVYFEQCQQTMAIQSALRSAYYPTSNVPYANYCASRALNTQSISEEAPSKENPCNHFLY